MAVLERQSSGIFRLRFYFQGKQHSHSLGTRSEKDAKGVEAGVKRTLWLLEHGQVSVPPGVDPLEWIISGGTASAKSSPTTATLSHVITAYRDATPDGVKAVSTRATEEVHFRHFLNVFGASKRLSAITPDAVADYVKRRLHKGQVSGTTVAKELMTFGMLWRFAESRSWVSGKLPSRRVPVPRPVSKEPFRTLSEIIELAAVADGDRAADLWECCVLDAKEMAEFLRHIERTATKPWLYPAIAACAFTGVRRSEWMRSRREDWDLDRGICTVREKKRVHRRQGSLRVIDVHPELVAILRRYLRRHCGGAIMFCLHPDQPLTLKQAVAGWKSVTAETKWANLNGYHTLRHSFASNLAAAGVPRDLIDRWMGHQTDVMRERYRHFFPAERQDAIARLVYRRADTRV